MADTNDNKKQLETTIPEVKPPTQQQPPVKQDVVGVNKTENKEPKPKLVEEPKIPQVDEKSNNLSGKKLQLVLYQVAKQNKSIFTQEQKFPVMASFSGVFLTLCTGTMINIGQFIMKPDQRKKKYFILFGVSNLIAAAFLGGYGIFKISDMYMKVPELQWMRIQKEKEEYEKLSFSQKKAFLIKSIQQDEQKLKENMIEMERKRRQEIVELTK